MYSNPQPLSSYTNTQANLANDWALFWVPIYIVHLTTCYYHVIVLSCWIFTLVAWMSNNSLLETDVVSEVLSGSNWIRTHNHLVRKRTQNHLAKLSKWWAVLWVLFCTMHLTTQLNHLACLAKWLSVLFTN